jgi:long-chain acyl-CoA synthetase
MTLAHLLARAAQVLPDHPAVRHGRRMVMDYRELGRRSLALAGALTARHALVPGDRVALVMVNEPAYLVALFGCWWAGLIAVPVNAKLHPREIAFILDDSGSRLVFTSATLETNAGDAVAQSQRRPDVVVAEGGDWRGLIDAPARTPIFPAGQDDPAWLFYTSGTTGAPKGAMLSHRNLLAMTGAYLSDVDPTSPADSIIHAAPMSHGSGLYVLPHVAAMATHVIPESGGFDPDEVVGLINAVPGSSLFAAPTMVHRLVHSPSVDQLNPEHLRTLVYGGGPMYLADCNAAVEVFGPRLAQIYGQGESPMTITVLPKWCFAASPASTDRHDQQARLGSVGFAQWPVEVVVADEHDQPLPVGEVGEILVRGDTVMSGYWNRAEASAETLRNGWLHTGDLGELDSAGFLTLRDRSKDVIISGGSNIYPREVEEILLQHERVSEVAVVGRHHPEWGEEVVAFVVADGVQPAELDALCIQQIARFKRPKEYHFVPALPKNNNGKVLKAQLRELLSASDRS